MSRWRWLEERYVAVKIRANRPNSPAKASEGELGILRHISKANPRHKGWYFVRKLLNSFTLDGVSGKHQCLVFEPLREPLWLYRERFIGNVIPPEILKIMLQMVLHGLDYLHSECHVIHTGTYFPLPRMVLLIRRTDLKPDNIMVKIEDPSILDIDARSELQNPLPQKHYEDGRTIYLSRNNYGQPHTTAGIIRITDFDLAVRGDVPHKGCIQAEVYRAPEVIINAGYTYSADIWSLGTMVIPQL